MRASRLLSILILLQLRTRLTAEQLAAEFEVSVRTIYRDIDALSAAGIPVYGERGIGGGFQLIDGYRTRLTGLARDEAEAMPMLALPGPAAALGLGAAAARARGKLLAALSPGGAGEAQRFLARFHHDAADWYRAADAAPHLPTLARAVLDDRMVTMRYDGWQGTHDWEIEPFGLVLKGGAWYVVAQGRTKMRTFRVSNILSLSVTDMGFVRSPLFDLAAHWAGSLDRFETGLRPFTATIEATPLGMKRLAALGRFAEQAVAAARQTGPDRFTLDLAIEGIDHAALMLLGIGPEIVVIEPAALRAKLRDLAQAVATAAVPDEPALSQAGAPR